VTSIDALAGIAAIDAANEQGTDVADVWDANQVTALTGSPTGKTKAGSYTEFYLDETPALQPQIDFSAKEKIRQEQENRDLKERQRTMGATMGGGPSYDPLTTGEEELTEPDYQTEAEAASWGLDLHAALRQMSGMKETDKGKHFGMKSARWHPDMAKWSDAKQKDFLAGFDKTLGAARVYSRQKSDWEAQKLNEEQKVIWAKVDQLVNQYSSEENLEKLMNAGYNLSQLTSILSDTSNLRDIIRHGIATNKFGLAKMTAYEIFKSGNEISDYKNNLAAALFARTLSPDQDFDKAWTEAVLQEKMNPGSTGLNLDWSAGTSDDPTIGDWWETLWGSYKQGGLLANPNQGNKAKTAWAALAHQAEQGD
jgi:hypothetical protein